MNFLVIRGIDKKFIVDNGIIHNIDIENSVFYHKLVSDLYCENTETFLYFKDTECIDYSKEVLFINDIYTANPNSRKILNSLYKKIKDNLTHSLQNEIIIINEHIIELLKKVELDVNLDVEFDTDLDLVTLLSAYNFTFKESTETILKKTITYIKANQEIKKFSLIITLNLLPLLNDSELLLLKKELDFLGVCVININLCSKINKQLVNNITIDDELCVF